jgi:hypothetical protein
LAGGITSINALIVELVEICLIIDRRVRVTRLAIGRVDAIPTVSSTSSNKLI